MRERRENDGSYPQMTRGRDPAGRSTSHTVFVALTALGVVALAGVQVLTLGRIQETTRRLDDLASTFPELEQRDEELMARDDELRAELNDKLAKVDIQLADSGQKLTEVKADTQKVGEQLQDVAGKQLDVTAVAQKALPSVVTIVADRQGSGFVLPAENDPDESWIATNYHVVANVLSDGDEPFVEILHGDDRVSGRVHDWDDEDDLAIIDVPLPFPALAWAVRNGHPPTRGEPVVAVGSPWGFEETTTSGILSNVDNQVVLTDVALNPGNSGGPLLNRFGEVVAVNTLGAGQNFNVAVRVEQLCDLDLPCP